MKKLLLLFLCAVVGGFLFVYEKAPSTKRKPNYYDITVERSQTDFDGDGIYDDQDILESVLSYLETKPRYKSKYYETGYPNDSYRTCVDVVGFGLLGAGHDLQTLVDEDIQAHPERYDIVERDRNIDFRRVKNLIVYFQWNSFKLSTDVNQIEEWRAGDIVIFPNHIGIISDHRNARGVSYVFHHANPFQLQYEEDILEKRNDIVGHYRISK